MDHCMRWTYEPEQGFKLTLTKTQDNVLVMLTHSEWDASTAVVPLEEMVEMLKWLCHEEKPKSFMIDNEVRLRDKFSDQIQNSQHEKYVKLRGILEGCKLYMKDHPKATWHDLWKNVPNDYVQAHNMRRSLEARDD